MLRLLSSDLVLDEVDDFDLADLPAVARLVNWAGMLGSRVLLSSATMPPAMVSALFDAYAAGRSKYLDARGTPGQSRAICCAWFDEFDSKAELVQNNGQLMTHHQTFVDKRVVQLTGPKSLDPLRQAELIAVNTTEPDGFEKAGDRRQRAVNALAESIYGSIGQLHQSHHIEEPGGNRTLSVGLVRMANIAPLVAVSKQLLSVPAPDNTHIHYCVYHSQFPLVVRSGIEKRLDDVLSRKDEDAIWQKPAIRKAVEGSSARHHIFVVVASPVSEVGRDHDYDWAIVEPSSMRSIVQLAGRILRHRRKNVTSSNIHLLEQNYKALVGATVAFTKPGFETGKRQMASNHLGELLQPQQYRKINAIERVKPPSFDPPLPQNQNLVSFEHSQLTAKLTQGDYAANVWWRGLVDLTYEFQKQTRFRQSSPSDDYVLLANEEQGEEPTFVFHQWMATGELKAQANKFVLEDICAAGKTHGVSLWGQGTYLQQLTSLLDKLNQQHEGLDEPTEQSDKMSLAEASIKFGSVNLREADTWHYDEALGFYQPVN